MKKITIIIYDTNGYVKEVHNRNKYYSEKNVLYINELNYLKKIKNRLIKQKNGIQIKSFNIFPDYVNKKIVPKSLYEILKIYKDRICILKNRSLNSDMFLMEYSLSSLRKLEITCKKSTYEKFIEIIDSNVEFIHMQMNKN